MAFFRHNFKVWWTQITTFTAFVAVFFLYSNHQIFHYLFSFSCTFFFSHLSLTVYSRGKRLSCSRRSSISCALSDTIPNSSRMRILWRVFLSQGENWFSLFNGKTFTLLCLDSEAERIPKMHWTARLDERAAIKVSYQSSCIFSRRRRSYWDESIREVKKDTLKK